MSIPGDVTQLLIDWRNGNEAALEQLMLIVYEELRRLADRQMRNERTDHTLEATGLVNEAYLRLLKCGDVDWQNRAHFFGFASRLMRNILVDYARARQAAKRGVGLTLTIEDTGSNLGVRDIDLIALDNALAKLTAIDEQQSRIIELRYFGGLTIEEVAEVLQISPARVHREWQVAKLWLIRELNGK